MPDFDYRASTPAGKLERGSLAAASKQAALRQLRNMGLTPVQVVAASGKVGARKASASGAEPSSADSVAAGVTRDMVVSFTAELATLLRAGLPIDRALRVQEEMSVNPALSGLLGALIKDVKGGKPLSSALERHDQQFGHFYLNMVRAGEVS